MQWLRVPTGALVDERSDPPSKVRRIWGSLPRSHQAADLTTELKCLPVHGHLVVIETSGDLLTRGCEGSRRGGAST
jgi:hypothetical protein